MRAKIFDRDPKAYYHTVDVGGRESSPFFFKVIDFFAYARYNSVKHIFIRR